MSENICPDCMLSLIIPCYNEERTLRECVLRASAIADDTLAIEMIIVDDCSTDQSLEIANALRDEIPGLVVLRHAKNLGKGAALRTGFAEAKGDFVAVQDADLEYNPSDLKKLLKPLQADQADVVLGSRFLSTGAHSVLYFWHYLGNRLLTLLSNMFTDLRLTDMETCYKVFRREVIQSINIKEDRFGFEPEIIAKISHRKLRIFEMAISYSGRTYEEGKKIGFRDALRAVYCIMRYNVRKAPWPVQLATYLTMGGCAALLNAAVFFAMYSAEMSVDLSILAAFLFTAPVHYFLFILNLFRRNSVQRSAADGAIFLVAASLVGAVDFVATKLLLGMDLPVMLAKIASAALTMLINFKGRRFLIFPDWDATAWTIRKVKLPTKKSTLSRAAEKRSSEVVDQ